MAPPRFLPAGDTALVVEFGDRVDRGLSARVLALAQKLEAAQLAGVVEAVPTFRSLMVHYDPLQTSQLVYMMGFLPGLPYLGGLPGEFALARRENPRVKVPKGSVAVAMSMSVVYPQESPGGWHILARTPVPLWDMRKTPPALLAAGDQVTFLPLSLREYELMLAKAAADALVLTPEGHHP